MAKEKRGDSMAGMTPPKSAVSQLMGLYLVVSFTICVAWLLGSLSVSFLWVFLMVFGLFVVWKGRLRRLVECNIDWHREHLYRKRALKQDETAEWLNFLINRWWVFSSFTIEDLVKRRVTERLQTVKPKYVDHIELAAFTFGDLTPCIRNVKVFECVDGVPGFKPACWSNITQPPLGLDKMSSYQVVLETNMASRCDDFRMVFRARLGGKRVGLTFDVAVEELHVTGTLQIILHMSMEVPFPHVTKASFSFTDIPEVWYNIKILKAIHLTEIPLVKLWIQVNVMEGIIKALVDPGKLDFHFGKVGPVAYRTPPKQDSSNKLAQGVLTVTVRGTPAVNAGDDIHYTTLKVGKNKRQTIELQALESWEDCCSFFVYNLAKDKLQIKYKCKRVLSTETLEYHELQLSSFPFQVTKLIAHEILNQDGSKLQLQMDYTPVQQIDLEREDKLVVNVLKPCGVLYVCVHCAKNVIVSDRTGSSDPYCVVFCDRKRVLTTPYRIQTTDPVWESHTEFFVKDFSQVNLSFYVFDWDGTSVVDDDFLGSTSLTLSMQTPVKIRENLMLGYNKYGQGHVADPAYGQITVSVVFRPVASVEKSERFRQTSVDSLNNNNDFLYIEDMVSPASTMLKGHRRPQQGGGKKVVTSQGSRSLPEDDPFRDKISVDLEILQARDLIAMDRNGFSDPFCEVKLQGTRLFRTGVKKKTLNPNWNESVTFQMSEDCGMLEMAVYDKDIFADDFLGNVLLTLDQLKELSLKGTADWFDLQRTHSGQIQLRCLVTARDTVDIPHGSSGYHSRASQSPESIAESPVGQIQAAPLGSRSPDYGSPFGKQGTKRPFIDSSLDNEVFVSPGHQKSHLSPVIDNSLDGTLGNTSKSVAVPHSGPKTSTPAPTPQKRDHSPLKKSTSNEKLNSKERSNSLNSFAAFQREISIVPSSSSSLDKLSSHLHMRSLLVKVVAEPSEVVNSDKGVSPDAVEEEECLLERLYGVKGKVMSLQGFNTREGFIYCKIRIKRPNAHRLRKMLGNRVIAKSALVKAAQPVFNLEFDVDHGMGTSSDAQIIFDIKGEKKDHLATQEFSLKSLFDEPGGAADKVQKMLTLEHGLQLEVYIERLQPDLHLINRNYGSRRTTLPVSRSLRREKQET